MKKKCIKIFLSDEEYQKVREDSWKLGLSISSYVRMRLVSSLTEEIQKILKNTTPQKPVSLKRTPPPQPEGFDYRYVKHIWENLRRNGYPLTEFNADEKDVKEWLERIGYYTEKNHFKKGDLIFKSIVNVINKLIETEGEIEERLNPEQIFKNEKMGMG